MTTPGERIEQERIRRGLTREQLAKEIDGPVGAKTIQRIEDGTRPDSKLRFLIEEYLGITHDPAVGDEDTIDKDAILRSVSDVELASEQLRRAVLRADGGDDQTSSAQPKRGRRGTAPRNLTQSDSTNRASPDK